MRAPVCVRVRALLLTTVVCFIAGRTVAATGITAAAGAPPRATFAQLGVPLDGNTRYCTDCAATAPCTGSGAGAFAYRVGSAWNCNTGSSGGSGLATDGSTTGATSVIQPFTNGIKTTATTGLVGIGMAPNQMLDVTAPSTLIAVNLAGTQPASSGTIGTAAQSILIANAPNGGDCTSNSNGRTGGTGSGIAITLGNGGVESGTGNSTGRGGIGGGTTLVLGNGGAATGATGSVKGGQGGSFSGSAGTGGAAQTHVGISGKGGGWNFNAGPGGDNSVSGGTSGGGGDVSWDAGPAGAASGGATAGTNGTVSIGGTSAATVNVGNSSSTTTITGEFATSESSRAAGDVTSTNTTFTNMTGISRTVLVAGNYVGELVVKCNNSVAGEGIKFDFNGGSATVTNFWAAANVLVGGSDVLGTGISTSLAGVLNFSTITGETVVIVKISFVVNAAGTVIPRFAENSTAIGTATVELGSFMNLNKTP